MSLIGNPNTPTEYVAAYSQAVVGLFGIPAGGFVADIEAFGEATGWNVESLYAALLNSSIGRSMYAPGANNQSFATNLVAKLGGSLLSADDRTAAIDAVKSLLDGGLSRASVAQQIVAFVANIDTADAVYGVVGQQFQNRIVVADYYTFQTENASTSLSTLQNVLSNVNDTTDVTDPEEVLNSNPGITTGQTFTLTSGVDYADNTTAFLNGGVVPSEFKFTSGNETVNAAGGTFSAADILVDNSTTDNDVLNATLTGTSPIAANLTNIETLKLNLAGNGAGLDFAAITGAKAVEISGTQNGVLSNVAAAAPEVTLTGGYNKTLTVAFDTLAGTSTSSPESLKVNLNGAGSSAAVQINIEGTANTGSLEQLTINSTGSAANTLTVGTTDYGGTGTDYAAASGITKFTVTGDQALTLKTDHATISTKTVEHTGTGALTLDIDRGTATTQVTSLAQAAGFSSLVLRGTGDINVSGIANGSTVTLVDSFAGTGADSLSVKGAATGTADSLTLVLDHKTDATNLSFGAAFTVNDIETVSVVSNGGDSTGHVLGGTGTTDGFSANAAKTINLSGDTKLTLNLGTDTKFETFNIEGAAKHAVDFVGTAVTYAAEKNVTINAGTATGDLKLDVSAIQLATAVGAVETLSVTTGTGKDDITVGSFAGAKLVLDAGAGDNKVTAGDFGGTGSASSDAYTSASTITTGTGKDTITVGKVEGTTEVKASLAIDAGDGENTVVVGGSSTISGTLSITGGAGKDTIVAATAATATAFNNVSGKLTISTGAGDDTVKLGNVTKNGSTIDLGEGNDTLYVGSAGTGTAAIVNDVVITTGAGKDTIYLSNSAAGVTASGDNNQKVVITDFTAGANGDVLNLTGWAGTSFATSFGTASAGVTSGLVKLGAFDAGDITAAGTDKAFNVTGGTSDAKAVAVLFNNNTGLTEVWMAYDLDGTGTSTDVVVQKIATLENVTLTGIADLKIENFDFS